jgi:hypothetical protein
MGNDPKSGHEVNATPRKAQVPPCTPPARPDKGAEQIRALQKTCDNLAKEMESFSNIVENNQDSIEEALKELGSEQKLIKEALKELGSAGANSWTIVATLCAAVAAIGVILGSCKLYLSDAGAKPNDVSEVSEVRDELKNLTQKIERLRPPQAAQFAADPAFATQVGSLNGKVDGLQQAMAQLSQEVRKSPQPAPVTVSEEDVKKIAAAVRTPRWLVDEVATAVQAKLEPEIKKMVTSSGPTQLDPKVIRSAVQEALASKQFQDSLSDTVLAKWKAAQPKDPPAPLTGQELHAALKENAEAVRKELEGVAKKIDEASKVQPAPSEPLDVVVLATHSQRLPANEWIEPYKRLFATLRHDQKQYRVGFCLAITGKLQARIGLKDENIGDNSFYITAPSGTETERPDLVGPDLLDQFDARRPNQRCVLVASVRCAAPRADGDGWKAIPAVDVILIRPDRQATDTADMAAWLEFCAAKNGSLTLLAAGNPKTAKSPLSEQLYQHLFRLAQPQGRK